MKAKLNRYMRNMNLSSRNKTLWPVVTWRGDNKQPDKEQRRKEDSNTQKGNKGSGHEGESKTKHREHRNKRRSKWNRKHGKTWTGTSKLDTRDRGSERGTQGNATLTGKHRKNINQTKTRPRQTNNNTRTKHYLIRHQQYRITQKAGTQPLIRSREKRFYVVS